MLQCSTPHLPVLQGLRFHGSVCRKAIPILPEKTGSTACNLTVRQQNITLPIAMYARRHAPSAPPCTAVATAPILQHTSIDRSTVFACLAVSLGRCTERGSRVTVAVQQFSLSTVARPNLCLQARHFNNFPRTSGIPVLSYFLPLRRPFFPPSQTSNEITGKSRLFPVCFA